MTREILTDLLKELKEVYGVVAIKAEFEAEGSRKDELIMLREIIYQADMGFIVKIGGCEAVHDLDQCKLLDATGVMAPMIETPFAMKKFRSAAERVYKENMNYVEWIINAETVTCLENYDDILKAGGGFLTGVTVGRSDLSGSMGIERKDIEGEEVFKATDILITKSRNFGLVTNFGGNIGVESVPFIRRLEGKIDRYETRKVVITPEGDAEHMKAQIRHALNFELEYLKFKSEYYRLMSEEDSARIARMQRQINI